MAYEGRGRPMQGKGVKKLMKLIYTKYFVYMCECHNEAYFFSN